MATFAELRQKYPQYKDMSDEDFAGRFHQKFYSDVPREEFNKRIGFTSQQPEGMPQEGALMRSLRAAQDNPVTDVVLGAGDALKNTLTEGANLLPGVDIPRTKSSSGLAYEGGNIAGELASMMGPGGAIKLATRGIPMLAGKAGAIGANAVGAGAYGALMNEGERAQQGGIGAGASLAADIALPKALQLGGKLLNAFKPQKYAEEVMQGIGGGKSLSETHKELATSIKNAFEKQNSEAQKLYHPVFDKHGSGKLYPEFNNLEGYGAVDTELSKFFGRDVKKMRDKFEAKPTLDNAHRFQRQIGTAIGKLESKNKKSGLSTHEEDSISALREARDAVMADMDIYLRKKNPKMADKFVEATDFYRENVSPYKSSEALRKISNGDIKSVGANFFKNPENKASIQKILADTPKEIADKIVYSEVGKINSQITPDRLARKIEDLDRIGLGSYISPTLAKQLETLKGRMTAKKLATMGIGAAVGGKAGHAVMSEFGGALGGAAIAPSIAEKIGTKLGMSDGKLGQAMKGLGTSMHQPLVKAMLAKYLSGGQ